MYLFIREIEQVGNVWQNIRVDRLRCSVDPLDKRNVIMALNTQKLQIVKVEKVFHGCEFFMVDNEPSFNDFMTALANSVFPFNYKALATIPTRRIV